MARKRKPVTIENGDDTVERIRKTKEPSAKRKRLIADLKEQGISDQQYIRFAHAYVTLGDPTKAAMSVGIGRTSGTWNEEKAVAGGRFLLDHPVVRSHIQYLNRRITPALKISLEGFNDLLAEMMQVTFNDYFIWDEDVGDYVVKPFHYLTKAELMCLSDVSQYQHLVKMTRDDGAEAVQSISLRMVDKLKLMDMYAELNGFYGRAGGDSADELQRKIRSAMAAIETTDGA
jgi:hypothetical protein